MKLYKGSLFTVLCCKYDLKLICADITGNGFNIYLTDILSKDKYFPVSFDHLC